MDRVHVNVPVAIPAHTSVPRPRYKVLNAIFPSVTISPVNPVTLCTAYPVTDPLRFFILVKPDRASGVVLANTYKVYTTTLLGSLWPNTSTPWSSVLDIRMRDMQLCNRTNLQRKQREMRLIFQLELFGLMDSTSTLFKTMIILYTRTLLVFLARALDRVFQRFSFTLKKGHIPKTSDFFKNF